MSFRARDDERRHSLDAEEIDAEMDLDAFGLGALEDAVDDANSPSSEATARPFLRPPRRALRRNDSSTGGDGSSSQTTTRLLEALEALSNETGGAMPPSLRSLLGQLQGDETEMSAMFPFMQLLDNQHGRYPRFQRMLQSIDADAPAHIQLSGLSELCESLSLSTEDALVVSGFRADAFLPPILHLIKFPSNMEVLLLAARALVAIFDLFPRVAIPLAMANDTFVASICDKLLEIEYMDVAEMAFQLLDRIVVYPSGTSGDYRRAVISANGFVALLQFIDFFPIEIQRKAARVVSGLCANVGVESVAELQIAVPMIQNLLQSSDSEMMQYGCQSFQLLAGSPAFQGHGDGHRIASLVAAEETVEKLIELLTAFVMPPPSSERDTNQTRPSLAACTSILQFGSAVLSAKCGTNGTSGAWTRLVERLRFTQLPPLLAKLVDHPAVVEDIVLLKETLQLIMKVLPTTTRASTAGQAATTHHEEETTATMDLFAQQVLPSVIHVYEVSSRHEVRRDCLRVVLRTSEMMMMVRPTSSSKSLNTRGASTAAHLDLLAAFLASVLRPQSRSGNITATTSKPMPISADHGETLLMALQIVHAHLVGAPGGGSGVAATAVVFERHGVSAAVRSYATSATEDTEQQTTLFAQVRRLAQQIVADGIGCQEETSPFMGMESSGKTLKQTLQAVDVALVRVRDQQQQDHEEDALHHALQSLFSFCQERMQKSQAQNGPLWLTAHEISSSGLSSLLTRVLQDPMGRRIFAQVFLPESADTSGAASDEVVPAVVAGLVACVQDAISAEKEAFRVGLHVPGRKLPVSTGSVTGDMDQLTQHLKVKVKIDDTTGSTSTSSSSDALARNKRIVHNTVVLVESLARIETIEEYISEKLFGKRSTLSASEKTGQQQQEASAASARSRRRHRRSRTSEESDEKSDDEDEDAEDEEHDDQEDEDGEEQEEYAEEEEDEREDEEEADREANELRSDRPQKQKRLQVLYGGVVVQSDVSVLEAILTTTTTKKPPSATGADDDTGNAELAAVWSGAPHEFVFRVVSETTNKIVPETPSQNEPNAVEAVVLGVTKAAEQPTWWWEDVWDLLEIVKHLHDLLSASGHQKQRQHHNLFVNTYISLQVSRALSQPIRVLTNSLPKWCFRLMDDFAFMVEYETRFDFIYATTSGAPRAISYLCRTLWKKASTAEEPHLAASVAAGSASTGAGAALARRPLRREHTGAHGRTGSPLSTAAATLTNLSRMAKLPRLKVRVARSRLLPSAMKLLSMYGGKKAIIEIEFLGEVGTGLGPTTEFYTVVCQELQAAHLKLWRNDKDVPSAEDQDDEEEGEEEEGTTATSQQKQPKAKSKKTEEKNKKKKQPTGLPIRGYHRVAVYHCASCKHLEIPKCGIHDQLLTFEKAADDDDGGDTTMTTSTTATTTGSIPQCSLCLDTQDWWSACASCKTCSAKTTTAATMTTTPTTPAADAASSESGTSISMAPENKPCRLKWWILSDEEIEYLAKVYPQDATSITHPVLQCTHCDTVNFPGTDAGILVLDPRGSGGGSDKMMARTGRRMYERDYRAVTKHVSPLCEGTPLKVIGVTLTRVAVETLVKCTRKSPELLESQVDALSYMSEVGTTQAEVDIVDAPFGLFPKPLLPLPSSDETLEKKEKGEPRAKKTPSKPGQSSVGAADKTTAAEILLWFEFLGRFVAQAILDERLVNLPFSRAFVRALRGEQMVFLQAHAPEKRDFLKSLSFVHEMDPAIATSLHFLYELATSTTTSKTKENETQVQAMELFFTLVGQPSIELCAGGKTRAVELANLEEYVLSQVTFLLDKSIHQQVDAFHRGFQITTGCKNGQQFLQQFSIDELEFILSDKWLHQGEKTMWSRDGKELREAMVCDHGFTCHSQTIQDLVAVLCELPLEQQRLFVKFVTGANRLPLGGLAKLEPKLTVVRKVGDAGGGSSGEDVAAADAVLPSASTCTNYLKLPEYSTRQVLKDRLVYCIHEGQGSFHLS